MNANTLARQVNPAAFVRVAGNAPRRERCQVLLQGDGEAYLVASGPTWPHALQGFRRWHEENVENGPFGGGTW